MNLLPWVSSTNSARILGSLGMVLFHQGVLHRFSSQTKLASSLFISNMSLSYILAVRVIYNFHSGYFSEKGINSPQEAKAVPYMDQEADVK